MSATSSTYDRGAAALGRGAWDDAREAFECAIREKETAVALEGLGLAAWWLDLAGVVFESRERAYRLYLDADDHAAAARVAVWLAWDCWAFRGESAVANGWLQRARRLLEGMPDCVERAWLECREGALALLEEGDPDRAHAHAAKGFALLGLPEASISRCWPCGLDGAGRIGCSCRRQRAGRSEYGRD
jgi:tetratricopeptide (TPR) repeat protein